ATVAAPDRRAHARGRGSRRPGPTGTALRTDRRRDRRLPTVHCGLRAPGQRRAARPRRPVADGLLRGLTGPPCRRPMRGPDFVQSLERGLAVIRAFDAAHPELTLSEVAAATGVTRAAARRFLLTLAELGYVRTDGRLFSLSPKMLELGYAYLSGLSL